MVRSVYSKRSSDFDIKKFTHIFFWWFSTRSNVFEMCSADTMLLLLLSIGSHDSKMS